MAHCTGKEGGVGGQDEIYGMVGRGSWGRQGGGVGGGGGGYFLQGARVGSVVGPGRKNPMQASSLRPPAQIPTENDHLYARITVTDHSAVFDSLGSLCQERRRGRWGSRPARGSPRVSTGQWD